MPGAGSAGPVSAVKVAEGRYSILYGGKQSLVGGSGMMCSIWGHGTEGLWVEPGGSEGPKGEKQARYGVLVLAILHTSHTVSSLEGAARCSREADR